MYEHRHYVHVVSKHRRCTVGESQISQYFSYIDVVKSIDDYSLRSRWWNK